MWGGGADGEHAAGGGGDLEAEGVGESGEELVVPEVESNVRGIGIEVEALEGFVDFVGLVFVPVKKPQEGEAVILGDPDTGVVGVEVIGGAGGGGMGGEAAFEEVEAFRGEGVVLFAGGVHAA